MDLNLPAMETTRVLQSTAILTILVLMVVLGTFLGPVATSEGKPLIPAAEGTLTGLLIAVALVPKAPATAPERCFRYAAAALVVGLTLIVMTYPLHMTLLPSPCAAHWRSWLMGEAFEEYACGPSWEYAGDFVTLLLTSIALVLAVLRFKTPSSYARNSVYCIATNWFCWVIWALEDYTDWCKKTVDAHEQVNVINKYLAALGKFLNALLFVWIAVLVLRRTQKMDPSGWQLAVCGHTAWWLVGIIAAGALCTQLARFIHIYLGTGDEWTTVSGISAAIMLPIWIYFAWLHAQAFEANRRVLKEDSELPGAVVVQVKWALRVLRTELQAGLILSIITGAHWALTGVVGLFGVEKYSEAYFVLLHCLKRLAGIADAWGLLMLSGLLQRNGGHAVKPPVPTNRGLRDSPDDAVWTAKVEELAHRGVRVGDLMDFYQQLLEGQVMPSFDPRYSQTSDVAREAVIPMSRVDEDGFALASIWNQQRPCLAGRMVTHNWGNRFSHLVAAILADATGQAYFADVVDALQTLEDFAEFRDSLQNTEQVMDATYWVCVFSVNQHASICGGFGPCPDTAYAYNQWDAKRRNSVTGEIFPLCGCKRKKYFNNEAALTELNKFDDLMRFLAENVPDFVHVTVADDDLDVFKRAWCVAELVEGSALNIRQTLLIHSTACLDKNYSKLKTLDIQACEASRAEDKDQILSRIDDIQGFNEYLGWLVFDAEGIFSGFLDREARLSLVGRLSERARCDKDSKV